MPQLPAFSVWMMMRALGHCSRHAFVPLAIMRQSIDQSSESLWLILPTGQSIPLVISFPTWISSGSAPAFFIALRASTVWS